MSNLKTCPDCGKRFWTTEGYQFCFLCHKQRLGAIRRSGYLTPLPRLRPPRRRDERGVVQ
jgi:hypothetical protein